MEENRVQFEAWWLHDDQKELRRICARGWGEKIWQASRASIKIELLKPKKGCLPGDYHIGYDSGAESQYESDVEAIRAAGLKIKGE